MDLDLNEIAIFVKVVESGSFSMAARVLGIPKSTVSAKVSSLEQRLGLTLIQRTTRKLNITPPGQTFYLRCAGGLSEILAAQSEVTSAQSEPQGTLRLTAPAELGSTILPSIVSGYMKKFKKVKLELILSDRRVDLISEGIDLAIRGGNLADSSLIAKKLGNIYFAPIASPSYVKSAGLPKSPKDLVDHQCIQYNSTGIEEWKLTGSKGSIVVPMSGRILINDLDMVKSLVFAGHGIGLLPNFLCSEDLIKGRLVRVLPDWKSHSSDVHFVYPAQKFVSPKVSSFIAYATDPVRAALTEHGK